ncbi:type I 3-dehydroquinate dehydratase [Candidatus Woesearchaeota archaeon]|nr:type I 3-dehydroquinate dehydratase [Candidatus Woesearchaeota archaeon]
MIATPITANTEKKALAQMTKAAYAGAECLELRIDYMWQPDLKQLINHLPHISKIVTNRPMDEGGRAQCPEYKRILQLQEAIMHGADMVDIEFRHWTPLNKKDTSIIVSHHDFDRTPDDLEELYKRMEDTGADILKLATKANTKEDCTRMFKLIEKARTPIIGICLGELGIPTRIHGPWKGSYLTFAAIDKESATAQGQLTISQLKDAWAIHGYTA